MKIKNYVENNYSYTLLPSRDQKELIEEVIDIYRLLFNTILLCKREKKKINTIYDYIDMATDEATGLERNFIYKMNQSFLGSMIQKSLKAYDVNKKLKKGMPRKKSPASREVVKIKINDNIKINFGSNRVSLPYVGEIKYKKKQNSMNVMDARELHIVRDGSNYYINIITRVMTNIKKRSMNTKFLGIDYSQPSLYIDSDGKEAGYPRFATEAEDRVSLLFDKLGGCAKLSNSYKKTLTKISKEKAKAKKLRQEWFEYKTDLLANKYDVICIETLNFNEMIKTNVLLKKKIKENNFNEFIKMLDFKIRKKGGRVIYIPKYYATSKRCSRCGSIKKHIGLGERIFGCDDCGVLIDRDYNAAINIKRVGAYLFYKESGQHEEAERLLELYGKTILPGLENSLLKQ